MQKMGMQKDVKFRVYYFATPRKKNECSSRTLAREKPAQTKPGTIQTLVEHQPKGRENKGNFLPHRST